MRILKYLAVAVLISALWQAATTPDTRNGGSYLSTTVGYATNATVGIWNAVVPGSQTAFVRGRQCNAEEYANVKKVRKIVANNVSDEDARDVRRARRLYLNPDSSQDARDIAEAVTYRICKKAEDNISN